MEDMFNNYRMIEEVKERAVERGSGRTEFESYDRAALRTTPPDLVIITVK